MADRGSRPALTDELPEGFDPLGDDDELPPPGFIPESTIDRHTGAPLNVRSVVGSSPPGDRLSNMRRFYPEAQPYGDDNFIFQDPKSKLPALYNPPGLDPGDIASVGKEAVQTGAGAIGGAFGLAASTAQGFTTAPITVPLAAAGASTFAGEMYDTGMKYLGGMKDTRTADEHALDTITGFSSEALGQRLLPDAFGLLKRAGSSIKDRFTGATAKQMYEDFRQIGAKPTAGMVGSSAVQRLENAVGASPGGSNVIREADDAVLDSLNTEANRLARAYGPPLTEEEAGAEIKNAAKRTITRFSDKSSTLYQEVADKIPTDVKAVPQATLNLLAQRQQTELAKAMPNMVNQVHNTKVAKMLDTFAADVANIPDGKVNYQALAYMRERVGKMLGDPVAYSDFDRGELKQLYGAVSEDMNRVAKLAGPDAMKSHQLADRYYRYNMSKNVDFLSDIIDKGLDTQAYRSVMTGAKDTGQTLRTLRRNLLPGEWDMVAGTTLRRLGEETAGREGATGPLFSPATFLTNINKLSPEAVDALFGGTRYKDLMPQLNRLKTLAAGFKELQGSRNFSNTGPYMAYMRLTANTVGGTVGAGLGYLTGDEEQGNQGERTMMGGLMGGVVSPYIAAKLLTNPKFVRWMADSMRTAPDYHKWAGNLGRLVALAKAEPDIRNEIHDFLKVIPDAPPAQKRR